MRYTYFLHQSSTADYLRRKRSKDHTYMLFVTWYDHPHESWYLQVETHLYIILSILADLYLILADIESKRVTTVRLT